MAGSNENNPYVASCYIGTVAGGASKDAPCLHISKKTVIKGVKIINQATVAGSDSDNKILKLKEKGTDEVIAELELDVASGGLVALTGVDLPIDSDNAIRAAGENLFLEITETGGGLALTEAVLSLECYQA